MTEDKKVEEVEELAKNADKEKGQLEHENLSQFQLVWRQFVKHKLGVAGGLVILFLALITIFADFLSPYNFRQEKKRHLSRQ